MTQIEDLDRHDAPSDERARSVFRGWAPSRPRWLPRGWRLPVGAWEVLGIVAFTAWIAWPFVDPGGYVTDFDTVMYSGPNLEATYRAWGDGRMPWWEPGVFGGTAFSTNLQTAVFYPLKLVYWPLGAPAAMGAMTATHLFLLAFGMRHLARRTLHLAAPAGLVAAVVMVGAGSTMVRTVRFEQIAVMAWIPWLLVAVDAVMVAREGRRTRAIALCALVVALTILSGHPQQVHLAAVLTAVWIAARLVDHRSRTGADASDATWHRLGRVALAGVLGLGVAGVALVPALPVIGASAVTSDELLEQAAFHALEARDVVPTFFGDLWSPSPEITFPTPEFPAFLGVAAIGLAVVGAAVALTRGRGSLRPMRATAVALIVAGAASVWLALGPDALLYRVAARIVPGVGHGRVPLRWLFIATFAVAVLAAVGVSALRKHEFSRRPLLVSLLGAGLIVLVTASLAPPHGPGGVPVETRATWLAFVAVVATAVVVAVWRGQHRSARSVFALAAVAIVLVELGVPAANSYGRELRRSDSFVTSTKSDVNSFLSMSGDRYLLVGMSDANTSLTSGARTLDGYDGGMWLTDPYVNVAQRLAGGEFAPLNRLGEQMSFPIDSAELAKLGVRYVVIDPVDRVTRATGRPPLSDAELEAARREMIPGWIGPLLVGGTREVWENPSYESEAIVYPGDVNSRGVPAAVDRVTPEAIGVTTPPGPAGTLVLAEQAQPGWRVTVDGVPAELIDVDGFSLAVDLPAGSHDVEFRYRPPGLSLGLALTAISLATVVVLIARGPVSRRWWWQGRRRGARARG